MTDDRKRTGRNEISRIESSGFEIPSLDNIVSPDRSIQTAIERACPGDVIGIGGGSFTEQVVVDKPITLVGAGPKSTTIRSPVTPAEQLTVDGTSVTPVIAVQAARATLCNLTIDGDWRATETAQFAGISGRNAAVDVRNVTVRNVCTPPQHASDCGIGIFLGGDEEETYRIEIERCLIEEFGNTGIITSGPGIDVYIGSSTAIGKGPAAAVDQTGIRLDGARRATVVGSTITDHRSDSSLGGGLVVSGCSDVLVAWNKISDNTTGIKAKELEEAMIQRNNIDGNEIGIHNFGHEPLETTKNWWGGPDGPVNPSDRGSEANSATDEALEERGDTVYDVEWGPPSDTPFNLDRVKTGQ